MGNHECMNTVDVNCTSLAASPNIQEYMSTLAGHPQPYFTELRTGAKGTAKLIFIAANAWSDAQGTWLRQQLAMPTRYTFVVRHEPTESSTSSLAGVSASDAILAGAPVTLHLYGHTHEYRHPSANKVISGNAGAPLAAGWTRYGFVVVRERDDGNIAVSAYDASTGMPYDSWAVTPAGGATR
jgi:hypothetical protein